MNRRGRKFDLAYSCSWVLGPFKDGGRSYLLTSAGNTYFPHQLALIDVATGRVAREYWHPGVLNSVLVHDIDSDGRPEVLAAGVNNPDEGTGHPVLVVLDIPFRPARSDTPDQFGNPGVQETAYLLLPKIDVVDTIGQFTVARLLAITENAVIQLAVEAVPPSQASVVYRLDFDLRLLDFRPFDGFREFHRRLEREGVLGHSLTQAEIDSWRLVKPFPTAPDGNSPEVNALWASPGPRR